jgi:spore coat polysaccharide biosynthesis protein SpsF (cytidylyltransferase family)
MKTGKVVAVIQARMGSTRLPGKVLAELCGMKMIDVLLRRVSLAEGVDEIVVATTDNPADDVLVDWLMAGGTRVWRGNESDVLDRYWRCACMLEADVVVRLTADDPLKDPDIISQAVREFQSFVHVDYVSNTIAPTFPEGLDVEVIGMQALERAHFEATRKSDREHVTPYIWRNAERFKVHSFGMTPDLSHWRWTVDHPVDLEFVRQLLAKSGNDVEIGYRRLIEVIIANPYLMDINAGITRGAGYLASLQQEE